MNTWEVFENSRTELKGFNLSWLPKMAYSYLSVRLNTLSSEKHTIEVDVGPYVGAIPLNSGDTLSLLPRVGRQAFWRMLLVSEGLDRSIRKEFEDFVHFGYIEEGSTSWFDLLSRPYFEKLRLIEKKSLKHSKVKVRQRRNSLKGQIELIPTLINLTAQKTNPVQCLFYDTTYSIPENRVLAAAAGTLLRCNAVHKEHRDIAIRWMQKLRNIRLQEREFQYIISGLNLKRFTGSRSYYISALLMARLILGQAGITFDENLHVDIESVLVNMPDLFEKYIRTVLQNFLHPKGYYVEKRKNQTATLFTDGTCNLVPDVIISDKHDIQLILDTKYKPSETIAAQDYYQMCAYLSGYGIKKGVLILPTLSESSYMINKQTVLEQEIYELRVPLANWEVTEELLEEQVLRILAA